MLNCSNRAIGAQSTGDSNYTFTKNFLNYGGSFFSKILKLSPITDNIAIISKILSIIAIKKFVPIMPTLTMTESPLKLSKYLIDLNIETSPKANLGFTNISRLNEYGFLYKEVN